MVGLVFGWIVDAFGVSNATVFVLSRVEEETFDLLYYDWVALVLIAEMWFSLGIFGVAVNATSSCWSLKVFASRYCSIMVLLCETFCLWCCTLFCCWYGAFWLGMLLQVLIKLYWNIINYLNEKLKKVCMFTTHSHVTVCMVLWRYISVIIWLHKNQWFCQILI